MLSDAKFVIAGHPITSLGFLIAAALLLCVAAFLMAVARRSRRVSLHPSPVTDEIIIQLGRIAEAVERIAYQPLPNNVSASRATGHHQVAATGPGESSPHTIPYSMFGRER